VICKSSEYHPELMENAQWSVECLLHRPREHEIERHSNFQDAVFQRARRGMTQLRALSPGLLSFAVLTALLAARVVANANPVVHCDTPLNMIRLTSPLTHFGGKLARHEAITIIAIGSSSTWGAGASSRKASYPSRLEMELKSLFPHTPVTVINRGVSGEEVPDMLKRFHKAVIAAKPDLVLWQFGTNSVIRDQSSNQHAALIHDGLDRIRTIGADVVLIDPQFAPSLLVAFNATLAVRSRSARGSQHTSWLISSGSDSPKKPHPELSL